MGQHAVLCCRVSTADQSCARQERDLSAFAYRAGYEVVGTFKETGSGVNLDRAERKRVLALAQRREIDAVLVTELSRWGRSTTDMLATLKELETRRVSVIALNGMAFDLSTPHGRMIATVLAGIAEFERELIQERIHSGIAAAKARGKRLGRQIGHRPKSDRFTPKVLSLVALGRSYRLIGRELGEQEYRGGDRETQQSDDSRRYDVTEYRTRWATSADLPTLQSLMALAIDGLQTEFLSPEQVIASRAIMGLDTQLVEDGTYLLAEGNGVIAGCGGWSRRATLYGGDHSADLRDPKFLDPAQDAAKIRAMYTHPAFARQGVGRLILSECEKAAAAAGFSAVELMATLSGERLYAVSGYRPVEAVEAKVKDVVVPLIRMRKSLDKY